MQANYKMKADSPWGTKSRVKSLFIAVVMVTAYAAATRTYRNLEELWIHTLKAAGVIWVHLVFSFYTVRIYFWVFFLFFQDGSLKRRPTRLDRDGWTLPDGSSSGVQDWIFIQTKLIVLLIKPKERDKIHKNKMQQISIYLLPAGSELNCVSFYSAAKLTNYVNDSDCSH